MNPMANKNPRITATLPAGIMRALEWWAEQQGHRPSSLAAALLETAVRDAVMKGVIPQEAMIESPPKDSLSSGEELDIPEEVRERLEEFLGMLSRGEKPDTGQLVTLAQETGLDSRMLLKLCEQVQKEGSTNGI